MSAKFFGSHTDAFSPVMDIAEGADRGVEKGTALCLSGGGYRAMLFHLGALWRLNQLGLLKTLNRVSSVSGGSITAGVLGLAWMRLGFDGNGIATNFEREVVHPIRRLAGRTIDLPAVGVGAALPFVTAGDRIQAAYEKYLFGDATLRDLPADDQGPRFVINASNVQSGALWRFMRPYMADYRVGIVPDTSRVSLARAVAASSAFPPFLSPVKLELDSADFKPGSGTELQTEPYTTDVVLTDGGVYDNLGLETAYKRYETILVSDGGEVLRPEPTPKQDWARHSYRALLMILSQVASLRKRQLIAAYRQGVRKGAYFGIGSNIADYGLGTALPFPHAQTLALAMTPTRLKALSAERQERIINWGYAVCDAAIRKHVVPDAALPNLPYDRPAGPATAP